MSPSLSETHFHQCRVIGLEFIHVEIASKASIPNFSVLGKDLGGKNHCVNNFSLSDFTSVLQQKISLAPRSNYSEDGFSVVELAKGDYAVRMIEIPKGSKIRISSNDRARLLYVGKRNRPLFVLHENSTLVLKGKLELFYNTNNIREVSRLMVKHSTGSRIEFSPEVKVSLFSQKVE